jgi:hypothetical protein
VNSILAHLITGATAIWIIASILRAAPRRRRAAVEPPEAGPPLAAPPDPHRRLRIRMGIVERGLEMAELWGWDADTDAKMTRHIAMAMAHVDDELKRLAEETEKAEVPR